MFYKNNTLKRILSLLKVNKFLVLLSLVSAFIVVALSLYVPILIGDAIDNIVSVNNVNFNEIAKTIIAVAVCVGTSALLQWIMNVINNRITFNCVHDLREKAFKKIHKMPLSYLDSHPAGDTVSRVINDVDTFADGLLMGFTQLFSGVLTILGTLVLMLVINWQIAVIVVVLTPASLFVARFIATRTHKMFKLQAETKGEQTAFIDEMVGNQKTVQAFLHGKEAEEKFREINKRLEQTSLKAIFFSSMVNPSTRLVNSVIYAIVCLVGAISVINNPVFTVGALSCLLSYAGQYAKPFNEISGVITELQNAFTCAERVFAIIDEKEEAPDCDNKQLEYVKGEFEVKNVDFSYKPEKQLIKDLNLNVKPGQRVAIVGPTGCGKTTFINLLMRFYDVTDGDIKIDSFSIKEITRKSLRSNIGMVLQETWLKSGTIKDNIIMGAPNTTDDEIIAAAKATHAHSFIKRLPNGYDTVIGEDGGNLSQGQKQLLCITRIMLAKPPVLILDEATSSIDVRTESYIQRSFQKLMEGRTSFIVAHRLSTIKEADIILVMKDGNIIEQGNHKTLLEQKGFYHDLYYSQFAV